MGQKDQFLVDGRSVVTGASDGKAMACLDVCKIPELKKKKMKASEEFAFYSYPQAVRAKLDPFLKGVKKGDLCQNPKQFVCRPNKISAQILKKSLSFR